MKLFVEMPNLFNWIGAVEEVEGGRRISTFGVMRVKILWSGTRKSCLHHMFGRDGSMT